MYHQNAQKVPRDGEPASKSTVDISAHEAATFVSI
jgi:hypothetical protein